MMIETEIKILINRKSDIAVIKQNIIDCNILFPVYIFELDSHYQLEFISDCEEWELDDIILSCFPDYKFIKDPEKGRKEIRLQLTRYQSEHSTDEWGRPLEKPLNETKYLIKKSGNPEEKYYSQLKVLFEEYEQIYFINIVEGINKLTGERGFLLHNEFKTNNEKNDAVILKDRLYKTSNEAFRFGYYKLRDVVDADFEKYIQEKKKKINEIHKGPRKVIRDFINLCNKSEIGHILKLLDEFVVFEKRVNWQTKIRTEGLRQFEEYLRSSNQSLCSKQFKIRSSWNIHLPKIIIGVKFFSQSDDNKENNGAFLKYQQFSFTISKNKITHIIEE